MYVAWSKNCKVEPSRVYLRDNRVGPGLSLGSVWPTESILPGLFMQPSAFLRHTKREAKMGEPDCSIYTRRADTKDQGNCIRYRIEYIRDRRVQRPTYMYVYILHFLRAHVLQCIHAHSRGYSTASDCIRLTAHVGELTKVQTVRYGTGTCGDPLRLIYYNPPASPPLPKVFKERLRLTFPRCLAGTPKKPSIIYHPYPSLTFAHQISFS